MGTDVHGACVCVLRRLCRHGRVYRRVYTKAGTGVCADVRAETRVHTVCVTDLHTHTRGCTKPPVLPTLGHPAPRSRAGRGHPAVAVPVTQGRGVCARVSPCVSACSDACARLSPCLCVPVCVCPRVCPPPAPPRRCQSPGGRFDVAALARRAVALAVGPGAPCSASRRRPLLQPNFPGLGGRGGGGGTGGARGARHPATPARPQPAEPPASRGSGEGRRRRGAKKRVTREKQF